MVHPLFFRRRLRVRVRRPLRVRVQEKPVVRVVVVEEQSFEFFLFVQNLVHPPYRAGGIASMYGKCAFSYAFGFSRKITGLCAWLRLICFARSFAFASSDSSFKHPGYKTSTDTYGAKNVSDRIVHDAVVVPVLHP